MRFMIAVGIAAFLAACTPQTSAPTATPETTRATAALPDLPAMRRFSTTTATAPQRPNSEIAADFIDLAFQMESGRRLLFLSRFNTPITLRVTGPVPASVGPDLSALLSRFRREAGIDITRVSASAEANINIEMLPQAELQRLVPQAACFVVPRVTSWNEYKRERRSATLDWITLRTREKVAIFIPNDTSPQEIRDCLHEEIAQALGPLNDLYRLPDSVFNDDNFHTVLTGFDMLILRAFYDPALAPGMTRAEVETRLPGILARLNPAGQRRSGDAPPRATTRDWIDQIETALGPGTGHSRRIRSAKAAVNIAQANGWGDNRLGFSLFALGRLELGEDADLAFQAFVDAGNIYAQSSVTAIQEAHVALHLAAFALSAGQADLALRVVNAHQGTVTRAQNAALLATLLMIKAEALDDLGRASEAQSVRLDSLGWARYGFGTELQVRGRLAEIAALSPGSGNS